MWLLVTMWPVVRLRSAHVPGGQDATDLRGLPVAVPVEDRVQVVQVGLAVVAGNLALERGPRGVRVAAFTDPAPDRSDGRHSSSPPFSLLPVCVTQQLC